jgi:hypothetical protein
MPSLIRGKTLEVIKAILPLVVVIAVFQLTPLQMPADTFYRFLSSVGMVIGGMILFLVGIEVGLLPVGKAVGSELPKRGSLFLVIGVAFLMGFTATVAEPDVMVLTKQVDTVSQGAISERFLVYVIAIGVAFFVSLALVRIIKGFPMKYLLTIGYAIVLVLSFFTPREFLPVAFDSGGVTTGPMTVPIILALGLGFSSVITNRSALSDGFGLIGLASVGPIIGIMAMGTIIN